MAYTFTAAPDVGTGAAPTSVVSADVNGDGRLDLVTANYDAGTVSVRFGQGDGTFAGTSDITIGANTNPNAASVADVNGDGKLDLLTANSNVGTVSVRLGVGNGTFTSAANVAVGSGPGSLTVADVNRDGKADLLVTNSGSDTVSVRLGQGDGTFASASPAQISTGAGSQPTSVTTADVNGDGKLDLLVAGQGSNKVSVRLGSGDGTFTSAADVTVGTAPVSVTTADVNRDGKLDLLVANRLGSSVSVRLGVGDGTFTSAADVVVGAAPASVLATDVDHDGWIDLVTANRGDDTVSVRYGVGDGSFAGSTNIAVGTQPASVTAADVNGDGKTDLLVSNVGSNAVSVLLGATDAVPTLVAPVAIVSSAGSGARKIGDVITFTLFADSPVIGIGAPALTLSNGGTATYTGQDAQGRPVFAYTVVEGQDTADLQVTGVAANGGTIGDPGATFTASPDVATGASPSSVVTADLNGDGKLDLLTANYSSNTVSVRLGQGNGSFTDAGEVAVGTQPNAVAVADLNGDGKLDLLTANDSTGGRVSVRLGVGDGTFTGKPDVTVESNPIALTTADVNGDGKADLLVVKISGGISVRLGVGDGTFTEGAAVSVPGDLATSVTAADVNRDGKLDLLIGNRFNANVSVRLGVGNGTFSNAADVATGDTPASVTTADVDGDGKLDLLVANRLSDTVSVRLGQGDGTFTGSTNVAVGDAPASVTVADIDNDGKVDLVTANRDDGTVSVCYGGGDGTFSGTTNIAVGSQPASVTTADVDGDGRTDLLVANVGSNAVSILLNTSIAPKTLDVASLSSTPGADTDRAIDATRPVLQAAAANGSTLTLTYSEALDTASGHAPPASAFTVTAGSATVGVTGVAVSGQTVTLTLASALSPGQSVTVAYADPTSGDDTPAIQDSAGNDAASASRTFASGTPAPTGLALAPKDDSGNSSSDRITRFSDPFVTGSGESGASVLLFDDANNNGRVDGGEAFLGQGTVGSDGTFDVGIDLRGDGLHHIVAVQSGANGLSRASAPLDVTLDKTAPTVTGLAVTGPGLTGGTGTLTVGQTATLTLTLSEAVTRTNATGLKLTLNDGGTASFDAAASDATHLVFRHTVLVDQLAADLAVTGVTLAGATIEDIAGNPAVLTGAVANPAGTLRIDGLTGTGADETFRGTAGADTFRGMGGSDSYIVNDVGDTVFEAEGFGADRVFASKSYVLSAGQSIETLATTGAAGTGAINLTGNEKIQTLIGNAGANTLDGKGGADTLQGLSGNDSYLVDNAGDKVVEAAGGGTDRLFASVSYVLAAGQEVETLATTSSAGTGAINLTGNEKVQTLIGNAGANRLDGKAGADTMTGLAGNDVYTVDNAGDRVVEAAGGGTDDRVVASVSYTLGVGQQVEVLGTTSSAGIGALNLTGNELAQAVIGNAGANRLDGNAGADTLSGLGGQDIFLFTTALNANDRITDFVVTDDTMHLSRSVFTALTAGGLSQGAFKDLGVSGSSVDGSDRILYNSTTGVLSYDADGSGAGSAAVQFAILTVKAALTFEDFMVV